MAGHAVIVGLVREVEGWRVDADETVTVPGRASNAKREVVVLVSGVGAGHGRRWVRA